MPSRIYQRSSSSQPPTNWLAVTIVISGLLASNVGQFPDACHVPSSASGITHVSDETFVNALTLLSVGVLVQRLKSMVCSELLLAKDCASTSVTSPSTRLHLVPELDPAVFENIPWPTTSAPLVPTSTESKLEQFTKASPKTHVLVDVRDGMLTEVKLWLSLNVSRKAYAWVLVSAGRLKS